MSSFSWSCPVFTSCTAIKAQSPYYTKLHGNQSSVKFCFSFFFGLRALALQCSRRRFLIPTLKPARIYGGGALAQLFAFIKRCTGRLQSSTVKTAGRPYRRHIQSRFLLTHNFHHTWPPAVFLPALSSAELPHVFDVCRLRL